MRYRWWPVRVAGMTLALLGLALLAPGAARSQDATPPAFTFNPEIGAGDGTGLTILGRSPDYTLYQAESMDGTQTLDVWNRSTHEPKAIVGVGVTTAGGRHGVGKILGAVIDANNLVAFKYLEYPRDGFPAAVGVETYDVNTGKYTVVSPYNPVPDALLPTLIAVGQMDEDEFGNLARIVLFENGSERVRVTNLQTGAAQTAVATGDKVDGHVIDSLSSPVRFAGTGDIVVPARTVDGKELVIFTLRDHPLVGNPQSIEVGVEGKNVAVTNINVGGPADDLALVTILVQDWRNGPYSEVKRILLTSPPRLDPLVGVADTTPEGKVILQAKACTDPDAKGRFIIKVQVPGEGSTPRVWEMWEADAYGSSKDDSVLKKKIIADGGKSPFGRVIVGPSDDGQDGGAAGGNGQYFCGMGLGSSHAVVEVTKLVPGAYNCNAHVTGTYRLLGYSPDPLAMDGTVTLKLGAATTKQDGSVEVPVTMGVNLVAQDRQNGITISVTDDPNKVSPATLTFGNYGWDPGRLVVRDVHVVGSILWDGQRMGPLVNVGPFSPSLTGEAKGDRSKSTTFALRSAYGDGAELGFGSPADPNAPQPFEMTFLELFLVAFSGIGVHPA